MSDGEWQTVGKQSTICKVFSTDKRFDNELPCSENTTTIATFVSLVETAENPLQAALDASWFAVLSQSELSIGDLSDALDVLDFVVSRSPPSSDRADFVSQTLEHTELKSALGRLLEAECYERDHFIVICRYLALIRECWNASEASKFKSIACAFYRIFLKKVHTSPEKECFAAATHGVKQFLENYDTEEFEELVIDGYPSGSSPPDDFRLIPSHPRTQDVDGGLPFLRSNLEKGPFKSLDDYLDIHYRLLREEYVSALRDGIRNLRKSSFSHDLTSFMAAKVRSSDIVDEFGTITVNITSNQGKLHEFKTGVLVALPRNGLDGFIYLTCLDAEGAVVKLEFCNSNDSLSLKSSKSHQLLLLKSAYYEAFRHTLDALKSIIKLPFQECIINCVQDERAPTHWQRADQTALKNGFVSRLNSSQYDAFCQALTRRVCLIQGPPGTGKTYVGLRIVEAILKHKVTDTPVLVVCYTNHALDQFLEGMLLFTQSIVRIGGRSKSEKLAPYSFENLKNESNMWTLLSKEDRKKRNACYERMDKNRRLLQGEEELLGIVEGRTLFRKNEIVKLCEEFIQIPDTLEFLEVSALCKEATATKDFLGNCQETSDDLIDGYISARMATGDLSEKVIADKMRKIRPLNRFAFERVSEKLMYKYGNKGEKPRQPLTLNEKWRFYATLHWRMVTEDERVKDLLTKEDVADPYKFEQKRRRIKKRLVEKHSRHSGQLAHDTHCVNRFKAMQTAAMLRSLRIIGLTTTGAAKRRELLQELNCKILVVEEAAEILESHLVAILPEKTKQIILIGDHKQLSPCINNYILEKSFNFGVSLFERLVNNGMPYVTLNVQHRMKPSFLELLVPHIYENITSSPKVNDLESIRGMSKDLQFLTHKFNERQTGAQSASKSNTYEALMINALLDYLANQGYAAHQIVVLCAYAGQQAHVSDLLRRGGSVSRLVRVSTIDDYQGEESDIVIVSFVRCNPHGEIGFLAKPNRVCVALSRARKGLFCFGDFESYAKRSNVWRGILDTLRKLGSIGPHLELKCRSHGTLAQVQKAEDFAKYMPNGRCPKDCNALLDCGHQCTHPCHSGDPHPPCYKPCLFVRSSCKHPCRKLCHQDHGVCQEIVPKLLRCGHTGDGPCPTSPLVLQCQKRCQKVLGCGHRCGALCGVTCTLSCLATVPITRDCDHDAEVACHAQEQERSQALCKTRVDVELTCGHSAKIQCNRAMDMDSLTSSCMANVPSVALPCGHVQNMLCREYQKLARHLCKQPVEVELLCGHACRVPCCQSKQNSVITNETLICETLVEVVAACGHRVNLPCKSAAHAALYCVETVEVELACGHACLTSCSRARNEVELRKLKEACEEMIFVEAPCTHLVEVACGKQYDGTFLLSFCKIIVSVISPCGHTVSVVCSSSRSADFVLKLCQVGRRVELTCNHSLSVPCSDLRSREEISRDCKETVHNTLNCSHVVEQVCNGTLGDLQVKCKQQCEFLHRCGHTCTGNCTSCRAGQNHRPCKLDCAKTLPCGHPCKGKCGRQCTACEAPCQRRCGHGFCEKKCGEPCSSRSQSCRRKGVDHCPHQRCAAKTCWECQCLPCKQRCGKKHDKCDHPCEGLCSEPCIPCFRCKPKHLTALFGTASLSGKFLLVPECNHVVDADVMDQVMASWTVGTPRCINCNADIPTWRRYNHVYNRIHMRSTMEGRKFADKECANDELMKQIHNLKAKFVASELREDSRDREMVRHYASQILIDLSSRLKGSKTDDMMLCDLVFQVLKSLVEVHEQVLQVKKNCIDDKAEQEKIFVLTRDIFEDLSDMVDMKPDSDSLWTLSVLDDIATHALRLKFVAFLPEVPENMRAQILRLISAEGRFSLITANAMLKNWNAKLKVQPFYEI